MTYIPGNSGGAMDNFVVGYTGDGITTVFEIPENAHIQVGRLEMYETIDFNRVGTTVTFVEAPGYSEEIAWSVPTSEITGTNAETIDGYNTSVASAASTIPVRGTDQTIKGANHASLGSAGAAGTAIFADSNGKVPAAASSISDGSIVTAMLAANAVTKITSAVSTSEFSTSSTTFVDVTGLSMSVVTSGGDLLVWLMGGGFGCLNNGGPTYAAINVNGTDYTVAHAQNSTGSIYNCLSGFVIVTGLAAGTYTVKARLKISGGISTGYLNVGSGSRATLLAVEIKK